MEVNVRACRAMDKECRRPPEPGRSKDRIVSKGLQEEHGLMTMTSAKCSLRGFQLSKPLRFW